MIACFNCWLHVPSRCIAVLAFLILAACDSPEERMQSHYRRGLELLEKKEPIKAGLEFRNALKINDEFVPGLYELAKVEEYKNNWRNVIGILNKIVDLDPNQLNIRIKLGKLLLLAGQTNHALKHATAAQALIGDAGDTIDATTRADVLALRSAILYKLDDKEGAVRLAEQARLAVPSNVDALTVLAAERLAAGDAAAALAYLDRGLEQNERNVGLQVFKIKVLEALNDKKQAEAVFRRLIELYPKTKAFRLALVRYLVSLDRKKDAEKELRAMAAGNPKDAAAGLAVVQFLNTVKGADAARQELAARIAKGGDVFPYQIVLARLDSSQGKREAAERLLRGIIVHEPTSANGITAQLELAKLLLRAKKREEARNLISDVLSKDEKNVEGLVISATLQKDDGEYENAIVDLRTSLNEKPRSPRILALLSEVHELNGSIELADEQLAVATRVSNFQPRIGLTYFRFLLRHGRLERAEEVLEEVLVRQPRQREALSALANLRLRRQNWLGAQEVAETIRKLGDEEGASDQILAAALTGQKKYEESIQVLQAAHAASPTAVQPMVQLVRTYVRAGKLDEATSFVNNILDASPDNAQAHVLLGSLHLASDRRDEAIASFERAIEKGPGDIAGYGALAALHMRENRLKDAEQVLRQGLKKQPQNLLLRLTLAGLLERTEQFDVAIKEYERMLELRPGSPVLTNNLASLLAEHRSDAASLERAYALAKRFKTSPVPHFKDTLGWTHFRRGEYDPAVILLKEARDGAPELALIRYHLGRAYLALGQTDLAREEFTKALELSDDRHFPQRDETKEALQQAKSAATQ